MVYKYYLLIQISNVIPNLKIIFCVLKYPVDSNPFWNLITLKPTYGILFLEYRIDREN